MQNNNLAKIIFIGLEFVSLYAVVTIAYSTSIEHWAQASFITISAVLAVTMHHEQQKIEWSDKDDEMENKIQSYIDSKLDEGR